MKGISLPLETVVLLILAAVILAALLGFFLGTFTPAQTEADLARQQIIVCQEVANMNCDPDSDAAAKLLDQGICKADRPACTGTTATDCVRSCCKIFCP